MLGEAITLRILMDISVLAVSRPIRGTRPTFLKDQATNLEPTKNRLILSTCATVT